MMDRYCEFCVNLRSVVYCKADAAYLCLSCDTKVHSANPLSKRHHRTLICDMCRRRPTYVRCYHHQKFMCRGCDRSQHEASSQHIKRVMNSYVGCPSARDLGALWGFDLSRFGSNSCTSSSTNVVDLETNKHVKIYGGIQASILQQLVDLLRLQTSDVDQIPSVIRCEEHKVVQDDIDQSSQQLWLGEGHPNHQEMIMDSCSSPFTQLDHLESETDVIDLQGGPFWQCKSRVPSGQDKSANTLVTNSESSPKKARYASQIMSFSHSRFSAESSRTMSIDSGTSPSCRSLEDNESAKLEEKKNIQLQDSKQKQYGYRKARSDTRKRTKSQSWKFESHGSVARSF